jgi:catechol 2,3-dioxygenase-like lactoylglutathione lyase family enzyme
MTTSTSSPLAGRAAVTGVDFVMVPVQDLDRARAFYGDVLGLEASAVWQGKGPSALGAEFETGTLTLALMDVAAIGSTFSTGAGAIALHVDDVAGARTALEEQGVEFVMDTIDSGVCHQAIFRDTEGNTLILHNRYAPKGS